MEKCGRAGQATAGNITGRMRFACWITRATSTPLEYVTLVTFPRQHGYTKASLFYRVRTMSLPSVRSLS